jgi:alkanesulfonate monooxygenase SsuD/methylene tetrahydromethanopterin reductase-like flavin-dependent oxidoreductase (luciferase family)
VEFGVFITGYVPAYRREGDPDAEHHVLMEDLAVAIAADQAGFKYIWASEHHFLDEYSHMSASDVVFGYLAHATKRAHIGSAIFNPLAAVNHPAKVAERVAMLDHISEGRFEFGTGRGAGSHEILGFMPGVKDLSDTRGMWEETIGEFSKMWLNETYEGFQGKHWSLPPRVVLPKPYKRLHPPMWYAAGNTSSWEMAAHKGLGVLGFSVGDVESLAPVLDAYKSAIATAEPVGGFVNDNVMVTTAAFVGEDAETAMQRAVDSRLAYRLSNQYRYHDTFPRPEGVPAWPDLIPDFDRDQLAGMASSGALVVGDPDQALAQCQRWADAGADQLTFGMAEGTLEERLDIIRLLGEHVIPKLDLDPVHRTDRLRGVAAAD